MLLLMKISKPQLMLIMAIVALCAAPLAHAVPMVPDGTYIFTATDGDTALNGSSVTFSSDTIVNWDLMDVLAPTNGAPTDIPLTPSNSSILSMGVLGANAWYFTIDGNHIATQPFDSFEGDNNVISPGAGHLFDGFGDPTGIWSAAASTPDSGSSLGLLTLALGGIGGVRCLVRRPVLSPKVS
jgi:hypothetical protein